MSFRSVFVLAVTVAAGVVQVDMPGEKLTLPAGNSMANIRHPSHFILVGPDARVLGLYQSTDPAAMAALTARVRAIAQSMPAAPAHSPPPTGATKPPR